MRVWRGEVQLLWRRPLAKLLLKVSIAFFIISGVIRGLIEISFERYSEMRVNGVRIGRLDTVYLIPYGYRYLLLFSAVFLLLGGAVVFGAMLWDGLYIRSIRSIREGNKRRVDDRENHRLFMGITIQMRQQGQLEEARELSSRVLHS